MNRDTAVATQIIDDAQTRVTRYDFTIGAQTGWHEHEFDYVITAITDCQMEIETPDGKTNNAKVNAGHAYKRSAGVKHNVINAGKIAMSFVEVEIK